MYSLLLYRTLPLDSNALHYSIFHYHTIIYYSQQRVYRALIFEPLKEVKVYYAMEQSTSSL